MATLHSTARVARATDTLLNIRTKEKAREERDIAETLLQLRHPKVHKRPETRAPTPQEIEKARGLGIPHFENFTVEIRYRRRHNSRRTFDLYYIAPSGKKYRSFLEIQRDSLEAPGEASDSDEYHTSDDDSDTETEQLRAAADIDNYTITLVLVTDATKKPSEIAVPPSATVADVLGMVRKPNALFIYGGYVRDHGARLQDFVRNTRAGRRFVAGILHDPSPVCVADRLLTCLESGSAHFKTWARTLE